MLDLIIGLFKGELVRQRIPKVDVKSTTITTDKLITYLLPYCNRLDGQDAKYQMIDSDWPIDSYKYFKRHLNNLGLDNYNSLYFDCDDFAFNYWIWSRNMYSIGEHDAQSPSIGVCKYPGHIINFIMTDKGIRFFEPQTGKYIDTPNGVYFMQF